MLSWKIVTAFQVTSFKLHFSFLRHHMSLYEITLTLFTTEFSGKINLRLVRWPCPANVAAIVGVAQCKPPPGNIVSPLYQPVSGSVSYPASSVSGECQSRGFALCARLGDGRQQVVINSVQNNQLAALAEDEVVERVEGNVGVKNDSYVMKPSSWNFWKRLNTNRNGIGIKYVCQKLQFSNLKKWINCIIWINCAALEICV